MAEEPSLVDQLRRAAGPPVWDRILQVVDRINNGPRGEIVVGTARKAICLLDVLTNVSLVRPDKLVYSSRTVDIDPSIFKGKSVLVVEDLITSTRTLNSTILGLTGSGATEVSVIGLGVHSGYPSASQMQLEDSKRTPRLSETDAAHLSETLVALLDLAGRTYNVDWPIFYGSATENYLEHIRTIPGWSFVTHPAENGECLTFYPNHIEVHPEFEDRIAIPKVRVTHTRGRVPGLTLVPIVALDRYDKTLGAEISQEYPQLPNGKYAPMAFAQYVMSKQLGLRFQSEAREWTGTNSRFREKAQTIRLSFGGNFAGAIRKHSTKNEPVGSRLIHTPKSPPTSAVVVFDPPTDPVLNSEIFLYLSSSFYDYYVDSGEKALRDRAASGSVDANDELIASNHLLSSGLSVYELQKELATWGYSDRSALAGVTAYLDKAIDGGLVVPSMTPKGRRYRPGEAAMFNNRAKRLCEVVLKELCKTQHSGHISQFLTQKALVALWKHGADTYLKGGNSDQLVSVQYYRHGAVLESGERAQIARSGNLIVSSVLESTGVITASETGGFLVADEQIFESFDDVVEDNVKSLAATLAKMSHATSAEWKNEVEFIRWISTADNSQAPTALAADIALCRHEFIAAAQILVDRLAQGVQSEEVLRRGRSQLWHQTLAEGWHKAHWILSDQNGRFESFHLEKAATNVWEKSFLESFIQRVKGPAVAPVVLELRNLAADWLIGARLVWSSLAALVSATGIESLERHSSIAVSILEFLAVESGHSHRALKIAEDVLAEPSKVDHKILRVAIDRLADDSNRVLDAIDVTIGPAGCEDTFDSMTSAVVFVTDNCEPRHFAASLRAAKGGSSDLQIVDISDTLNIDGIYGVAAKGLKSADAVIRLAMTLTIEKPSRYKQSFAFGNLRSDFSISRSSSTNRVFCESFRNQLYSILEDVDSPDAVHVVGAGADLPTSLTYSKTDRRNTQLFIRYHSASSFRLSDYTVQSYKFDAPYVAIPKGEKLEYPISTKTSLLVFCPMPVERAAFHSVFELSAKDLAWVENPLGLPMFGGLLKSASGKSIDFIIAAPRDKGPVAARNAVARALDYVDPTCIGVLGIAGGLAPDIDYGDVVVASELVPYDYRKERNDGTELKVRGGLPVSQLGQNLFAGLEFSAPVIYRPDGSSSRFVCKPVASGDTVVRSDLGDVKRYLTEHTLKPAVTEMEAAAIGHELASRGDMYVSRSIVVRGVSDLADPDKDNSYHDLAARNACVVFRAMLDRFPVLPNPS